MIHGRITPGEEFNIYIEPTNNCTDDGLNWLDGNIDSDPLFCNADSSDFTLQNISPCIGTGQGGSNMGAYGIGCEFVPYDGPSWYVSPSGSDDNDGSEESPFATIQHGIDASSDGDSVHVSVGYYQENLDMNGKAITLVGDGLEETGIVGDGTAPVILINDPVAGIVKIKGFNISGGMGLMGGEPDAPESSVGGGIFALYNNVHLEDLRIHSNTAHTGGGAFIYSSDQSQEILFMDNVEFDGNTALDNAGASALAWQISDQTLYVTNCVFQGQTSTDPYEAQVTAAIFGGNTSLVMDSTIFNSNMGHLELYGGGEENNFTIKNTTFEGVGSAAQANALSGVITAMVAEVLPNGNLIVEGRKQLSLTEGAEFIQIRGVVRARDVQPDNTVSSMRMAQAQISYRGTGNLAESTQPGWITQLLFKYWPL